MKQKTQLRGMLMLLLTAFIWGSAFVAQSVGMESVQAFTFSGVRTILGALVLLPFILIRDRITGRHMTPAQLDGRRASDRKTVRCGILIGIVFCAAGNFQQFAFNYSTSGKIAFITALYMFFVPLIGLFFKKRVSAVTWCCVIAGFAGLYFLCIDPKEGFGSINRGDLLAFICSILFAVHILMVEHYAQDVDGVKLSFVQFVTAGILSCILMFVFEKPSLTAIRAAAVPILYAGILSSGLAYTFQIIGQKYTEATIASLLMCMESVFAVICTAILLPEQGMSARELLGCGIMFAAIIVSQLAEMKKK